MKEFIDKLIKELAYSKEHEHNVGVNEFMENGRTLDAEFFRGKELAYKDAISIVNQLAEEYKVSEMPTGSEDYCEWRLIDYDANAYDTTCRNPHILLEGNPTDNSYEFCPYCGKKIKVAPYTEGE